MEKLYSPQRLKDYALWYYFRYYPSDARLIQKLKEKGDHNDAIQVYRDISHLLQEDGIIASKIDNYIFRNKNYRYIRQKMREKLFPSEKTEMYLEKYINSWESLLSEDFIRRKIDIFITKGKSRQYIFQKLWETKQDKEILENILEEYFPNWEWENIKKEYEKIISRSPKLLTSGFEWRQKITQKLISKWFKYDEIKKTLTFFEKN